MLRAPIPTSAKYCSSEKSFDVTQGPTVYLIRNCTADMSGGASAVEQNSARVHGSKVNCVTSLDLNLNSPRSVEARTRCSMDERNFTTQSGDLSGRYRRKRGRLKAQGAKEHPAKTAIRTERNEINRHHLLREVRSDHSVYRMKMQHRSALL